MEKAKGILIKFIVSLIAFSVGLDLFFDATISDILSFAVAATAISYILADRILLPRFGKKNTLMAEFILIYMIVWIFGSILLDGYLQIAWGSLISAGIITAGEVFVHQYLLKHMPERKKGKHQHRRFRQPRLRYATEFAEEKDPRDHKKK
ncbi:YndM family protein [Fictibacillus phosphorivorans]|uniref:YndM family protein n=1 Tax=Fictibacillus phosphorivorans TaxID=1221500 RepID=UPI00203E08FC|nr:YndM family protein [Fictibacillus phosphorivorans]MCM3718708.1 YndM family protein [Fictibacillus phosphorivorans]MCM3776331.1 YndM family protein [Fictibacillus phosphorivorans]